MSDHPGQKAPGQNQAAEGSSGPPGPATYLFRSVWVDVRQGAEHFKRWTVPPANRPVLQFFHGVSLPFHLLRALWADPMARRRYLRVGILQSIAVIALTLTCHGSGTQAADSAREQAEPAGSTSAAIMEEEEDQEREAFKQGVKAKAEELKRAVIERTGAQEEAPAKAGEQAPEGILEGLERILERARDLAATSEWQFWVSLFAVMQIAQWVVIALSRDYHDAIGRDASLLTALEPEDPPLTPRVRVDARWVRNKLRRRIRALVVFLAGLPVIYAIAVLFYFTDTLMAVLVPLWSAYWIVVFTTAKSAHAWKNSAAGEPWFLRGWNRLTTRVPGFRWGFLQSYGRFWTRRTRDVFPPASEMEKQPWAFAGLTVVQVLAMLPLVKCFLRPLIPVAAAHMLVAKHAAELAEPRKVLEPPAKPPDASSASAA